MPHHRMIDWTLRERLEDRRINARAPTVNDTLIIVQSWIRACAKQAAKDGNSIAHNVLKKTAEHLKTGDV